MVCLEDTHQNMTGNELRQRIDRLGLTYRAAAEKLGLSLPGLNHQMRDVHPVNRQTEIILLMIEKEHAVRRAGQSAKVKRPLSTKAPENPATLFGNPDAAVPYAASSRVLGLRRTPVPRARRRRPSDQGL